MAAMEFTHCSLLTRASKMDLILVVVLVSEFPTGLHPPYNKNPLPCAYMTGTKAGQGTQHYWAEPSKELSIMNTPTSVPASMRQIHKPVSERYKKLSQAPTVVVWRPNSILKSVIDNLQLFCCACCVFKRIEHGKCACIILLYSGNGLPIPINELQD